jgi:hypothetical protein
MKILAINIDLVTSWAFYNDLHTKKITNGRVTFKQDLDETIKAPYKRFYKILESSIYHQNNINYIYYKISKNCPDEIKNLYISAINDFIKNYNLNEAIEINKENLKNIKINICKKHKISITDKNDVYPFLMIYKKLLN